MPKMTIAQHAEDIISKLPNLATVEDQTDIYGFDKTHYYLLSDKEINKAIYQHFLTNGVVSQWSTGLQEQIKSIIPLMTTIVKEVPKFDDNPDLINVNNGVIDLSTPFPHKLLPHSPDYNFTSTTNVDYDPEALNAPNFMDFISTSITLPDMTPDIEVIRNIMMMCGYLIYPQQKMEGLFIFLGDGSNGKSLLIEIIESFFPKKLRSYLSLRDIAKSDMERDQLMTSRLNISGEEKGKPIDSSEIKKVSSGQSIILKRKFKEPISFKPNTKLIVDSNTIPQFKDSTHGTLRRLNIFKFHNRAVPKEVYEASQNPIGERLIIRRNRDTFLPAILKEKSAILNMWLKALCELREKDWTLPTTETTVETFKEYRESTDTLGYWLEQNYKVGGKSLVTDVLKDFRVHYEENFPGSRFSYSTKAIGNKIRQIFRLEGERVNYLTDSGTRSTTMEYDISPKHYSEDPVVPVSQMSEQQIMDELFT